MVYLLYIGIVIIVATMVLLLIRIAYLIYIASQGAFFARTSERRVESLVEMADLKGHERVVDLGCGDGELCIALACKGVMVDGIEIDPYYVWRAQSKVEKEGLVDNVSIVRADMWKCDLSDYDLVVMYGIKHIMPRMEKKLIAELEPGARVISVFFEFPNWEVAQEVGDIRLYKR